MCLSDHFLVFSHLLAWATSTKGYWDLSPLRLPTWIALDRIFSTYFSHEGAHTHSGPHDRQVLGQVGNLLNELPVSCLGRWPCGHLPMVPTMTLCLLVERFWSFFSYQLPQPLWVSKDQPPTLSHGFFQANLSHCAFLSLCLLLYSGLAALTSPLPALLAHL